MGTFIVLAILIAIAVLAPIYGADTRFDNNQPNWSWPPHQGRATLRSRGSCAGTQPWSVWT